MVLANADQQVVYQPPHRLHCCVDASYHLHHRRQLSVTACSCLQSELVQCRLEGVQRAQGSAGVRTMGNQCTYEGLERPLLVHVSRSRILASCWRRCCVDVLYALKQRYQRTSVPVSRGT